MTQCPECLDVDYKSVKGHWRMKHKGFPFPKIKKPPVKASGEEFDLFADDEKFVLDTSERTLGGINNQQNEMEIKEFKKQIVDLKQKNSDLTQLIAKRDTDIAKINNQQNDTVKKYNDLLENAEVMNELLEDYEESEEILKLEDLQKISDDREELPIDPSMILILVNFVNEICIMFDLDIELIPANIKFEAIYFAMFDRFVQLKKILEGIQEEMEE